MTLYFVCDCLVFVITFEKSIYIDNQLIWYNLLFIIFKIPLIIKNNLLLLQSHTNRNTNHYFYYKNIKLVNTLLINYKLSKILVITNGIYLNVIKNYGNQRTLDYNSSLLFSFLSLPDCIIHYMINFIFFRYSWLYIFKQTCLPRLSKNKKNIIQASNMSHNIIN